MDLKISVLECYKKKKKKSYINIQKIQVAESKMLHLITNVLPYVSNDTFHTELHINQVAKQHCNFIDASIFTQIL